MRRPSIDVVVPNYNYGAYLEECVRSVLMQPVEGLRVHIIDNASTDNSAQIARKLAAEDRRVSHDLRPVNLGGQASFNAALDWASAEYTMIVCSDDLLVPNVLGMAVDFLRRHPDVVFVHGGEQRYVTGDPLPWGDRPPGAPSFRVETKGSFVRQACDGQWISAMTAIMRTADLKKVGPYHPDLSYCDDFELLLRLASRGATAKTKSAHFLRRIHSEQHTALVRGARLPELEEWARAFEIYFEGPGQSDPETPALARKVKRRLSGQALRWAAREGVARRWPLAVELTRAAFNFSPLAPLVAPIEPLRNLARR